MLALPLEVTIHPGSREDDPLVRQQHRLHLWRDASSLYLIAPHEHGQPHAAKRMPDPPQQPQLKRAFVAFPCAIDDNRAQRAKTGSGEEGKP